MGLLDEVTDASVVELGLAQEIVRVDDRVVVDGVGVDGLELRDQAGFDRGITFPIQFVADLHADQA